MKKRSVPYAFASLCLVVGMILAYVAFYYGSKMSAALKLEEVDAEAANIFQSECALSCVYKEDITPLIEKLQTIPAGLMMGGVSLFYDKVDAECITHVIVTPTEEVPYKFVSGAMPQNHDRPYAILGKAKKNETYRKNGEDYVLICGEEYCVAGYISAEHSVIYDYAYYIFWDSVTENVKEHINFISNNEVISMVLQSNTIDTREAFQDFCCNEPEYAEYLMPASDFSYWFGTEGYTTNYRAYAYLTYLLSVAILVMVTQYWMIKRRRELAIRRMDGFSSWQLIVLIAKDLLKLLLITATLICVVQQILNVVTGSDMRQVDMLVQLTSAVVFVVVTFILLMIYPIRHLLKQSVSEAIREGSRVG